MRYSIILLKLNINYEFTCYISLRILAIEGPNFSFIRECLKQKINTSICDVINTEYFVSMLIRRFVSLRVACVKSYHARPKVERDATLHRQREVVQTDGSIC